ncbi:MAG: tellurite resistance TerB family protein [Planctomycetota bacterium]
MGLLSRMFGSTPRKPVDEQLLVYGMLLMIAADGDIQAEELATLQGFLITVPDFRGKNLQDLLRSSQQLLRGKKSIDEAVAALDGIESPAVRKKLFVLAADLAMSSGDIDEGEEKLLELMGKRLGVDNALAERIVEVLAIKYAR